MPSTFTKLTLVLAVSGAMIGGVAFADQHKEKGERGMRGDRAERMFERMDADTDGKVTAEEMKMFTAKRFAKRDLDGDGVVTREDRQQMRVERRAERFAKIDADGDGMISLEEFTAHKPNRKARGEGRRGDRMRGHHGHKGHHGGKRMNRRAGGNGPLTIQEAEARAMQRFERIDSDDKGYITLNDMKAFRADKRGRN